MAGTNPIANWLLSKFTTQDPTTYRTAIDGNFAVAQRIVDNFAPHQNNPVAMNVVLDAGALYNGANLIEVASQTTAAFVAPVSNPRIDRVVINKATGTISVITGAENASPTAPALSTSVYPIAQVLLQTTSTYIANSMITDERSDLTGVAQHIAAATVKTTPVGADALGIWDSISGMLTQLSFTALLAYLLPNFLPANYFTPLVWTSGGDLSLGIGQSAKITATAATSIPLHIACGDGQIYEIEFNGPYALSSLTTNPLLEPNNTTYASAFLKTGLYVTGTTVSAVSATDSTFVISDGVLPTGYTCRVSTSTAHKWLNGSGIFTNTTTRYLGVITNEWTDTATLYTSLGTVVLSAAASLVIIVRRIA